MGGGMRDKRFSETQARRPRRRSHPPAPSSPQLSRPAFNAEGALIDATPARLRDEFGRCQDAERAQLRDMRIEKNRLAAIAKSDRAVRRSVIAMAKLERELAGVTFRLTARVHDRKKAVPTTRRKRVDLPPQRRLPGMGIAIVDRLGRRGIFVEVTSVGAHQARYRPGCARVHLNYIWAENAVERLASGALSRASNMGDTLEQVAAAMDLKEDVARASRANANIEIRIIVRLPDDISPEARFTILHQICEDFFGRNGLPYAAAVHPPDPHSDDRNFHGHIQAGFRPMHHVGGHEWDVGTELRTDLSRPEGMRLLRAVVADTMTEVCRSEGKQRTYTSLSNQERGLALRALKKVGREQTEAYRRGEYVGVVEENIRIIADNLKRYATQRGQWLKEKSTASRAPLTVAAGETLTRPRPDLRAPVGIVDTVVTTAVGKPRRASLSGSLRPASGGEMLTPSYGVDRSKAVVPRPVSQGVDADTMERVHPGIPNRPTTNDAARTVLAAPFNMSAAPFQTRPPVALMPIVLPSFSFVGITLDRVPVTRPALPAPVLPATPAARAGASNIDDALLLFRLRTAQKKERETLAARRRTLLDRHLFQQGDPHAPSPEYAAFLLAIRDDPTLLRWKLKSGGKRDVPVVARRNEAFAERFAVYMQHPAVRQQVTALFSDADAPGASWPAELANGMWRYEAGRYGYGAATTARAGWVENDARFRERIEPLHPTSPILETIDGLVVPGTRHIARWDDADLVRLLYPGVQEHFVAAYREQQEERVECLTALANGTARVERRLVFAGAGAVRPVVTPQPVSPALADAFMRWRDDPDFYLDTGSNGAAAKAAAERAARCANPHRRALAAARDAGDPPAVLRLLEDRIAASRPSDEAVDDSGKTSAGPDSLRESAKLRGRKKGRSRGTAPRRS